MQLTPVPINRVSYLFPPFLSASYLIFYSRSHTKQLAHLYQCYEQQGFNDVINRLFDLDQQSRLHNLVWAEFTQSIRVLLDNQYVFQPYWDYANGKLTEKQWIGKFDNARKIASKALGKGNSPAVLSISLSRLYTLRNQLMHGGRPGRVMCTGIRSGILKACWVSRSTYYRNHAGQPQ